MKIIKIMIAASEEMHDEKVRFSELIGHLNEVLEPRGVELKRVKWNSETDGSLEDYLTKLHDCEMCLTLYWKELTSNSEEELNKAYQQLKDGENPRKLYVFFKEPAEGLSGALKDFKANFVTNYGHFFCKFENVDTMNLHFILQFEAYQNRVQDLQNKLIEVKDGMVMVGDKPFVALNQIPFAAQNKEYARLQRELADFDLQVAKVRARHIANPNNEDLEDELFSLRALRKKKAKEFDEYQQHLFGMALQFARLAWEECSQRIRKARELFEAGDAIGADEILNMEEMKRNSERKLKQFEQERQNLELDIEEYRLKADTVMANTLKTISERFAEACDAYEQALTIARSIRHDPEKLSRLLFDYAYLLQNFNRMYEAVDIYTKALEILKRLAAATPEAYLPDVATTLTNLANLQSDLARYEEAEKGYLEALEIRKRLAAVIPEANLPYVATTLTNLANLQSDLARYEEAEKGYLEALEILKRLAAATTDAYLPDVARTLNCLAILQKDLGRYEEAEKGYLESLEILKPLAAANPEAYLPDVATTLTNLANLQSDLARYEEAEKGYIEALEILKRLAAANPDAYFPDVARALNNLANLQSDLSRYEEAEKGYLEALEILKRLAAATPDAYLPYVATTLNNLANMLSDLGRYEEAEKGYLKALEILKPLAAATPDAFLFDVARTLNSLAILQKDLGCYEEAERGYLEALKILKRLAGANPDAYLLDMAGSLNSLAILQSNLGRYAEAKQNLTEALGIYENFEKQTPGRYAKMINFISLYLSSI